MLRRLMIIFLFFLSSYYACGQQTDNTEYRNEKNVYNHLLIKHIEYITDTGKYKLDTLFVEYNLTITDSLLPIIANTKLVILTIDKLREVLSYRKEIRLIRIFPLEYLDGEFSVSMVPFGTKLNEDGGFRYTNPGSYRAVYKYRRGKFKFLRFEDNGI